MPPTGAAGPDLWHGEGVLAVLAPGQGAQKPGMLTDWLELPGAESFFRWAGAIADADLLELGTTGDAEAIKDTAVTQPLVVAMSLFIARELGGMPGPVVHTVAVVGYAAAGPAGGLLAALIAFTPSFCFVLGGGPHFGRLRRSARVQAFLVHLRAQGTIDSREQFPLRAESHAAGRTMLEVPSKLPIHFVIACCR